MSLRGKYRKADAGVAPKPLPMTSVPEGSFTALCKSCGADVVAPGNCTECGAAFHY